MEEIIYITRYVSAWMWHLIGIMFFIQTINLIISKNIMWMLGTGGVVIFCEVMAYLRKQELETLANEIE